VSSLIGRFLLATGDQVWMEDPGYSGALQTLRTTGARIIPVPVDKDGLIVKIGRKLAPKAKLAYVTLANQFPMGVTMSADRRMELLRWPPERTHGSSKMNTTLSTATSVTLFLLCMRSTVPVVSSTSAPSRR
jgi:DNA-binding transcriptional MocR family regulator